MVIMGITVKCTDSNSGFTGAKIKGHSLAGLFGDEPFVLSEDEGQIFHLTPLTPALFSPYECHTPYVSIMGGLGVFPQDFFLASN